MQSYIIEIILFCYIKWIMKVMLSKDALGRNLWADFYSIKRGDEPSKK